MTKSLLSKIRSKQKALGGARALTSYGIRYDTHDVLHVNDICNARLRYAPESNANEVKEVVVDLLPHAKTYLNMKDGGVMYAQYVKYLDYIIKHSPWKHCFLSPSARMALRYGLKMNVDVPLNQIVGAVIACREGYEFSEKLALFSKLSYGKNNKHAAYLISSLLKLVYKNTRYIEHGMNQGHHVLHKTMNWKGLVSFFKEGYPKKNERAFKISKQRSFAIYDSIAERNGNSLQNVLSAIGQSYRTGDGWMAAVYYPSKAPKELMKFITKELA